MDDESESLGCEADRSIPVEVPSPTGSYGSDCRKRAAKILKSQCDPLKFRIVVSDLPAHKIEAINNIGFGHLQDLKVDVLSQPMWSTCFYGVDLKNRSVKICDVDYNMNASQFTRVTGIRDGGSPVEMAEPEFGNTILTAEYCNVDGRLGMEGLIYIIRSRPHADPFFQIAYALFAMTTIICPTIDGMVETSLLASLESADEIRDKNWASFAMQRIFEGVDLYKREGTESMPGCMLFFQLLYLDVIGRGFGKVYKDIVPIAAWTTVDLEEVTQGVRRMGGFSAPLVVKKHNVAIKPRSDSPPAGTGFGIGFQRPLHEDVYDTKRDMAVLKENIVKLSDMLQQYLPDCREVRELAQKWKGELDEVEDTCVRRVVQELKEYANSPGNDPNKRKMSHGKQYGGPKNTNNPCVHYEPTRVVKNDPVSSHGKKAAAEGPIKDKPYCARRLSLDSDKGVPTPPKTCQPISETSSSPVGIDQVKDKTSAKSKDLHGTKSVVPRGHVRMMYNNAVLGDRKMKQVLMVPTVSNLGGWGNRFIAGPYTLKRSLPQSDLSLIKYVFLNGKVPTDEENKTPMADCGDGREILLRKHMRCLAPHTLVDMEVINYVAEFMSRDTATNWYLPTYFTTQANQVCQTENEYLDVAMRTRSVCNLFRFDGRVDKCDKIFIPLHKVEGGGHWWLLVVHTTKNVAEIWDSVRGYIHDDVSIHIARNALRHITETIFMTSKETGEFWRPAFESFDIVFSDIAPTQRGDAECGMFVIGHMQFYGEMWWDEYHSDEHRSSLLLQCMRSPASDIHEEVSHMANEFHNQTVHGAVAVHFGSRYQRAYNPTNLDI